MREPSLQFENIDLIRIRGGHCFKQEVRKQRRLVIYIYIYTKRIKVFIFNKLDVAYIVYLIRKNLNLQ